MRLGKTAKSEAKAVEKTAKTETKAVAKTAKTDSLAGVNGVKDIPLKVSAGVATGEVVLDKPAGELLLQAIPTGGPEAKASPVRRLDLAGMAAVAGGKPPAGWKEVTARGNAFTVWVPERARRQFERERTAAVHGLRFRSTVLQVETPGGLVYVAESLTLPPELAEKAPREELEELARDLAAADVGGKVTGETDAQCGSVAGKEYRVDGGRRAGRVRVFVAPGGRVLLFRVTGAPDEMEEFDLPAAYEALARAHLVAGDLTEARRYRELGVAETAKIAGEEDRRIMEADFATIHV